MSWSVSFMGKPAKPHLAALVRENFVKEGSGYSDLMIQLSASGSGAARSSTPGAEPEQLQHQVSVSIKPVWTKLLV